MMEVCVIPTSRYPPHTHRPANHSLKKQRGKCARKKRATELEGTFDALRFEGYTLVYTDGSSAGLEGVGRVASYGIYLHPDISIAIHVLVSFRQTNNTAELLVAIRALQIFTFGKIAICTDSEYGFSRSNRSNTKVAAKRLGREERPNVECACVGSK